jgi:hypothetical protein
VNNRGSKRSPSAADQRLAEARASVEADLDALGFTTRAILEKLGALSEAKKTLVAAKDGEFTDEIEVPDNPVRLNAVTTMLQLRRAFPSTKVEVSTTVRVEQLQAMVLRLEQLPPERLDQLLDAEDADLLALTEGSPPNAPEAREAGLP